MTTECFCIGCGYSLNHALSGKCPECGKQYSAAVIGSTTSDPKAYVRIPRRGRLKRVIVLLVLPLVLTISFYYVLQYAEYLEVRYQVWKAGGWDVVRVYGYDEGGSGYTVTGVVLAPRDHPNAVVELALGDHERLRNGEPIRLYGMKRVRLDGNDPRLLNDPRLSEQQRYDLQYMTGSLDVKDTGPLGHLFPHPIRNLNDLRIHYDEVYAVFSSFATTQPSGAATK
jgi:hypothetical protein